MAKVTDRFLYSDLDFNFAKTATNDVARKFDSNAIRQSLRNIVLTNFYERPFRPSLGVNLLSKLFDNFTNSVLGDIKRDVIRSLRTAEPRITLRDILVDYNNITSTLTVQIEYSFLDNNDTIDITIERVK
jgi:phage baseplate assembly protein W|tara:strand:+ start:1286 stop:1675 length:390 start_codon:yes stop_codon:yes gene_type:complete